MSADIRVKVTVETVDDESQTISASGSLIVPTIQEALDEVFGWLPVDSWTDIEIVVSRKDYDD